MKITKYPQSCLLVETKGIQILVDPGVINWDDTFYQDFKNVDFILVTHRHGDHINAEAVKKIIGFGKAKIYSSSEVISYYPEIRMNVVKEGDILDLSGVKVQVTKAIHGYTPLLKDGKEIFENVGYIIDDGSTRFYITSDTICFNHNYECDVVALPVCGHGIVMGAFEAALFAKDVEARLTIPIHYDNPLYPVDMTDLEKVLNKHEVNYKILQVWENVEV